MDGPREAKYGGDIELLCGCLCVHVRAQLLGMQADVCPNGVELALVLSEFGHKVVKPGLRCRRAKSKLPGIGIPLRGFRQFRGHVGRCLFNFSQFWPDFDQRWGDLNRHKPELVQIHLARIRIAIMSNGCGPISNGLGASSAESGPEWVNV